MELWSKGLGNISLIADLAEYNVVRECDNIILSGTVHNRILWKSKITISRDDMPGLLNFVFAFIFSRALVALILGKEKSPK